MTDPNLKPCPRCGGEAQIYVPQNNFDVCGVRCKKCGLGAEGWLSSEPRREAAAAWWNERPAEQALPELRCEADGKPLRLLRLHGNVYAEPCQCCIHDALATGYKDGHDAAIHLQPEPEPTRNAKDEPPPHQCPYGGFHITWFDWNEDGKPTWRRATQHCGHGGWLCDRCQQDRADRRTRALVDELAGIQCTMAALVDASRPKP